MSPLEAIVALNMLPTIGPVRVRRLLEAFGTAEEILRAPEDSLLRVGNIGPESARVIRRWQDYADPTKELAEASERGLQIITRDDNAYPEPLREMYDSPILLYVWGEVLPRDRHAIGMVGSRRATHYGTTATKRLGVQLAQAGFTIISGLARGIDTTAHEAALAGGGRTIAVIGSGMGQLYPPENFALAERIAAGNGAVVSEFPISTAPDKKTFPMRNRIVAGWCRALVVVECPARSGSLITANLANEYGKSVFAVPGPIDKPTSAGCNQLIRDGATLVFDGSHITDDLGELPFSRPTASAQTDALPSPALSGEEAALFDLLSSEETTVDRLIELSGLPAPAVTTTLMKLEMKRLARAFPGFRYARR